MENWIDIKQRLPERGIEVIFIADGIMYVGKRCDQKSCEEFHYNSTSQDPNGIENVMFWMSIPEKPING